jgi:tRNA modification GTPase
MASPSDLTPSSPLELDSAIVALSSAPGPGARAVVRLSGSGVWRIACANLFDRAAVPTEISRGRWTVSFTLPGVHSLLPGELLAWKKPASYTGQDLVELHLLASPPLVELLLAEALRNGARLARPGEFTLRAFLHGKLDLTQAEAVCGVIEAGDLEELKPALVQLAGGMARPLDDLRGALLDLLAEVEAGLDFAEEDLDFLSCEQLVKDLNQTRVSLEELLAQVEQRGVSGRSFRVVLAGPPNVGKSSLFNALTGRDAALVSPEPGTTRDYLEQQMLWDGIELLLVDTAGSETPEAGGWISAAAQSARRDQFQRADLLLWCVDHASRADQDAATQRSLRVGTKCDLQDSANRGTDLQTSAQTGQGLQELKQRVADIARGARRPSALAPSLTRCRQHVAAALGHVHEACTLAKDAAAPELLALELRLALDQIGELVGAVYTEDLLDRVFSQFCIGK